MWYGDPLIRNRMDFVKEERSVASFCRAVSCVQLPPDPSFTIKRYGSADQVSQGRPHPALGLLQRLTVQQKDIMWTNGFAKSQ